MVLRYFILTQVCAMLHPRPSLCNALIRQVRKTLHPCPFPPQSSATSSPAISAPLSASASLLYISSISLVYLPELSYVQRFLYPELDPSVLCAARTRLGFFPGEGDEPHQLRLDIIFAHVIYYIHQSVRSVDHRKFSRASAAWRRRISHPLGSTVSRVSISLWHLPDSKGLPPFSM